MSGQLALFFFGVAFGALVAVLVAVIAGDLGSGVWVFLAGTVALLLVGVYQAGKYAGEEKDR